MNERQISDREVKALQIAAKSKLTRKGNVWLVPSQAGHGDTRYAPIRKLRAARVPTSSLEMRDANMCSRSNT